jgi:hypothetical protein
MTCDGIMPVGIAFLKDGSVIANRRTTTNGPQDLWALKPSAPGGQCQAIANLTKLPGPKDYARDFTISPDGTQVAFVRRAFPPGQDAGNGLQFGGSLYIAPVNGSAPPTPFGGTEQYAYFGPRYVAGGTHISWNGVAAPPDGSIPEGGIPDSSENAVIEAGVPSINFARVSGGPTFAAVTSNIAAKQYIFGGGNGGACSFTLTCAMANGPGSAAGFAVSSIFVGAWIVRRRRRS